MEERCIESLIDEMLCPACQRRGFLVWGVGCEVWVWGMGLGVVRRGLGVEGTELMIEGFGLKV